MLEASTMWIRWQACLSKTKWYRKHGLDTTKKKSIYTLVIVCIECRQTTCSRVILGESIDNVSYLVSESYMLVIILDAKHYSIIYMYEMHMIITHQNIHLIYLSSLYSHYMYKIEVNRILRKRQQFYRPFFTLNWRDLAPHHIKLFMDPLQWWCD